MIDFYFWTTPNGYKILMFLEETGIPYRIMPVNISKGEQFEAEQGFRLYERIIRSWTN
jgi:GST-like protein